MDNKPFIISCVILLVAIILVIAITKRGAPVVVKTNLENLPMEIAVYKATNDSFSKSVYEELNADFHLYRHYRSKNGEQVDLYIGYYGTAKGGRTGHNPYACLPGAGWGIVKNKKIKISSENYPDGVSVNYVLAQKGEAYEIVLHWYQSAGSKVLATGVQQNIQRFRDRVLTNRNDGAFVRISVLSDQNAIDNAITLAKSFAKNILELLPQYWPFET